MEALPGDVVLLLLHKLAVQDPLSLVRATYALASFYRVAEATPSIWKQAFYGVAGDKGPEDISRLEAEIDVLGGYKTLVTGRPRVCSNDSRMNAQGEMKERCSYLEAPGRRFESNMFPGRILVLVRLDGRLLLWGVSDIHQRLAPCAENWRIFKGQWMNLPLEQLYAADRSLETMLKEARDRVDAEQPYYVTGQDKEALSIELYAYTTKKRRSKKSSSATYTIEGNGATHGVFHSLEISRGRQKDAHDLTLWGHIKTEPCRPRYQEAEVGVYSSLEVTSLSDPNWSFSWGLKVERQADLEKLSHGERARLAKSTLEREYRS